MADEDLSNKKDVLNLQLADILILLGVTVFALTVRLFFIRQLQKSICFYPMGVDEVFYDNWALSISQGHIIGRTVFNGMPLYAYFLGFIYSIFGHSIDAVRYIQAFLGTASCLIVYLLARHIFSRKIGLLSAFIYLMYGLFVFYEAHLLGVTLAIFLTLFAILMLFHSLLRQSTLNFFITGIIIGLSSLTMAGILTFIPFVLLGIFYIYGKKIKTLVSCLILLVGMVCPISIAALHNYLAEKDLVIMSAHGGITFYNGNNPNASPYFESIIELYGSGKESLIYDSRIVAEKDLKRSLKPSEVSSYWMRKGINYILHNPFDYVQLVFRKILAVLNKYEFYDSTISFKRMKQFTPILNIPVITFSMIFPFAILGILLNLRLNRKVYFLYSYLFSYTVFLILFMIFSRYRLPLLPVLIIFSACGFHKTWESVITQRKDLLRYAAIVFAGVLVVNIPVSEKNIETLGDYNYLGLSYTKIGDYNRAIEMFKEGISLYPDTAEFYNNLGRAYLFKGMFEDAELNIKKAISLRPYFPDQFPMRP